MDETLEELFKEKTKVVLNLIRPNNSATDVQQITQGLRNIVEAQLLMRQDTKPKRPGAGA